MRQRAIIPTLILLAAFLVPDEGEAQVISDTLRIEGFSPIANVVRRGCPDDPLRASVGSTITCTYVALDANGNPVPAAFTFRVGGDAGPFDVSLEEMGDSAVVTIEITGPGAASIVVDVRQPAEQLSFMLVVPHPENLEAGEVPAYYYQTAPDGPIEMEEPLSEAALWCIFHYVGSQRISKNDPECPGDLPLMRDVSETGLSVDFSCVTEEGLACSQDEGLAFVTEFDFGEGTDYQDVTASQLDTGLREARLDIEALSPMVEDPRKP